MSIGPEKAGKRGLSSGLTVRTAPTLHEAR